MTNIRVSINPLIRSILVLVLAGMVMAPATPVRAASGDPTCAVAAETLSGDDELSTAVYAGLIVGVTAMLANLVCFVADYRCDCLRRATDPEMPEFDQLVGEAFEILRACRDASNSDRSFSGVVQEAALKTCR